MKIVRDEEGRFRAFFGTMKELKLFYDELANGSRCFNCGYELDDDDYAYEVVEYDVAHQGFITTGERAVGYRCPNCYYWEKFD